MFIICFLGNEIYYLFMLIVWLQKGTKLLEHTVTSLYPHISFCCNEMYYFMSKKSSSVNYILTKNGQNFLDIQQHHYFPTSVSNIAFKFYLGIYIFKNCIVILHIFQNVTLNTDWKPIQEYFLEHRSSIGDIRTKQVRRTIISFGQINAYRIVASMLTYLWV